MKYEEVLDIVTTGEGYTIELKESLTASMARDICAFANSSGGKIILGVKDDGEIVGFTLKNSGASKIQNIARNMSPPFNVQVEQVENLVVVYVPEGKDKPYTVNGHFYMRYGANSQKLSRDEIRDLFQRENLISFERQKPLDFKDADFSDEVFQEFRKNAGLDESLSKEHILDNLNLLTDGALNNAGVLFFSKNAKRYHPTAIISCFLYADTEQVNIIDTKEFTEDLISNLNNAYKYLLSKLNTAIIIEGGLKHKTKLELPEEALREAIINALIHRDYLFPANVQINISPDKVEIINPGKLLFPIEELGKRNVLRNPILVDLAHRLGLVEKAGSGIKRIQRLAKEENVTVDFKTGIFFDVVFHRKVGRGTDTKDIQIRRKSDANPTQIRRKSDARERQKWIMHFLRSNKSITNKVVREHFDIHKDTAARDFHTMIEQNKIIKRGGGNNVWYELKDGEDEA